MNVAEGVIQVLRSLGVDRIFGVTGDTLFPFFDALGKQAENGIRFIGTGSEQGAAFMASYHAKVTGALGVCVASAGPGTANLVNGLADAYFDGAPVLAVTGQVATRKLGMGTKQEANHQQLLTAVTADSQLITSGEAAEAVILRAVEKALWEDTVVHVAIPGDVLFQEMAPPTVTVDPAALRPGKCGATGNVDAAVALLQNAERPLILVGEQDVSLREPILQLAERLGAGILLAQQAKGVVADDHPLLLGGVGEAYVPGIINEADALLRIGTAPFEKKYIPDDLLTVQLARRSGETDYIHVAQALTGALADLLAVLIEKLEPKEAGAWRQKIDHERAYRNGLLAEQRENDCAPLHPAWVMRVLSELVPSDALIVCDIGAFVHWFDSYFTVKEQRIYVSANWRSLGSALPGAIAAALARPEHKVLALVGDGGMLASLGELCTAAKYRVPVTVLVMNNGRYEIEQVRMEQQGLQPFGVDPARPDFAALAAACGLEGRRVISHDELASALQESFAQEAPMLLDVHVAQVGLPFVTG